MMTLRSSISAIVNRVKMLLIPNRHTQFRLRVRVAHTRATKGSVSKPKARNTRRLKLFAAHQPRRRAQLEEAVWQIFYLNNPKPAIFKVRVVLGIQPWYLYYECLHEPGLRGEGAMPTFRAKRRRPRRKRGFARLGSRFGLR